MPRAKGEPLPQSAANEQQLITFVMTTTAVSQLLMLVLHAAMGVMSESNAKSVVPYAKIFHLSSSGLYGLFAFGTSCQILQAVVKKQHLTDSGGVVLVGLSSAAYLCSVGVAGYQLLNHSDALHIAASTHLLSYGSLLLAATGMLTQVSKDACRATSKSDRQTFVGLALMNAALCMFAAEKLWQHTTELVAVTGVVSAIAAVVYSIGLSQLMTCCAPIEETAPRFR